MLTDAQREYNIEVYNALGQLPKTLFDIQMDEYMAARKAFRRRICELYDRDASKEEIAEFRATNTPVKPVEPESYTEMRMAQVAEITARLRAKYNITL